MSITVTKVANGYAVTIDASLAETVTKAQLAALFVFPTWEDAAYFISTKLNG